MPKEQTSPVFRYLRHVSGTQNTTGLADAELLERFVSRGDEAAFAALVRRHGPMVLAVCRRVLHNLHDAEDAFQATFLVLARKAAAVRQPGALACWLHGVAYRTSLKARAGAIRTPEIEAAPLRLPALEPLSELAWRELRLVLDEEIERLPTRYRTAVVLCYLEGQTYTEAARRLGCPPGTVSGRLARAREMLRVRLVRRGFTLSAGLLGALLTADAAPASVPLVLTNATATDATRAVTGPAAAGCSARVVALTEGVLRAMLLTRVKIMTAVLLFAGLAGAGGIVYRSQAAEKPAAAPPGALPGAGGAPDKGADLERYRSYLRSEYKRTIETKDEMYALRQIEEGLKRLKKTAAAVPAKKAAVDDFEKAFKQLHDRLQQKKPATSDAEDLRRRILEDLDRIIEMKLKEKGSSGTPGRPGDPRQSKTPPVPSFPGVPGNGGLPPQIEIPFVQVELPGMPPGMVGNRSTTEGLRKQIEQLRKELEDLRTREEERNRPGLFKRDENPPADSISGKVTAIEAATGLVRISIGSDAGLTKGHTLQVFRIDPIPAKSKVLGTLEVLSVRPNDAVARPVRQPAVPIKAGDSVAPRILQGR